MTRIILTRHGQTDWNQVERFRGLADIPLNATGRAQAHAVSRRIAAEWQPTALYASPLQRAWLTAEAIAAACGVQPIQPLPALIDIDYGQWQGLTPSEVRQQWPDELERWHQAPQTVHIPGGEMLEHVCQRVKDGLAMIVASHPEQTVVLVSHDSPSRALLLQILQWPIERYWQIAQANCTLNVFEVTGDRVTVQTLNETGHILGSGKT